MVQSSLGLGLDFSSFISSYYFKKHHLEYYQRLDRVRTQGDFEGWLSYYLKAIRDSALDAHRRAKEIESLEMNLKNIILNDAAFSKIREIAIHALSALFAQPITSVSEMSKTLDKVYNTSNHILKTFIKHGFVSETILHKRNKIYRFDPYLKLLEKEYD